MVRSSPRVHHPCSVLTPHASRIRMLLYCGFFMRHASVRCYRTHARPQVIGPKKKYRRTPRLIAPLPLPRSRTAKRNRVRIQDELDSETEDSALAYLSPAPGSEPKASVETSSFPRAGWPLVAELERRLTVAAAAEAATPGRPNPSACCSPFLRTMLVEIVPT